MQLQPSLHHRQAARRTQMEAERSSLAGPQASRRVLRRHILSSVAAPSLQIGYFVARVPAADRPALLYETLTQPVRQLAHALQAAGSPLLTRRGALGYCFGARGCLGALCSAAAHGS